MQVETALREIFARHQIAHYGWAPLQTPTTFAYYDQWLKQGHHGEMSYLQSHRDLKKNPERLLAKAKSALVAAVPYWPSSHPHPGIPQALKVARYAQGKDYHHWLKGLLGQVMAECAEKWPDEDYVSFVDSGPVLERDFAARAGLGWIGKNTCLIRQDGGSFFFIGEILTTLSLEQNLEEAADRCGTCTRCLDACPTGALVAPRVLDARLCLSYLTIESKADPALALRSQTAGQFYGCDICQEVCPWNIKIFPKELKATPQPPTRAELIREITEILLSSHSSLERRFSGTPLLRAPGWMHKRNAIWMAAHYRLNELKPELEKLLLDERLGSFCRWAIDQLTLPAE